MDVQRKDFKNIFTIWDLDWILKKKDNSVEWYASDISKYSFYFNNF